MNPIATAAGSSHLHRDGGGAGVGGWAGGPLVPGRKSSSPMATTTIPVTTSQRHRDGGEGGVGVGVGGTDFLGGRERGRAGGGVGGADFLAGPGRAEVARCQVLTNGIPLLAYSD